MSKIKISQILLSYLNNLCTSFCPIKFRDLRCQKPLEDRLKSYPYVSHFQHCLKSCQLIDTNMYLWNDLF